MWVKLTFRYFTHHLGNVNPPLCAFNLLLQLVITTLFALTIVFICFYHCSGKLIMILKVKHNTKTKILKQQQYNAIRNNKYMTLKYKITLQHFKIIVYFDKFFSLYKREEPQIM